MVEWFDSHSGFTTSLITFVLVAVTAIYVYLTRSLVKEAQDSRKIAKESLDELRQQQLNSAMPILVSYYQDEESLTDTKRHCIKRIYKVSNMGLGPALGVSLRFSSTDMSKDTCIWIGALGPGITYFIDCLTNSYGPGARPPDTTVAFIAECRDTYDREVIIEHTIPAKLSPNWDFKLKVNGHLVVDRSIPELPRR